MSEIGKLSELLKDGKSGYKMLDYRTLRAIVLLAVLLLGAYVAFFRLGVGEQHPDEPEYRNSGLEYVRDSRL